jgi:hypothetical protein
MSRKSKNEAEGRLQEALNEELPEIIRPSAIESDEQGTLIAGETEKEYEIEEVNKFSLRPKVGEGLPIAQRLVGCTKALFYEHRHQTTVETAAPYCLKANDHEFKGVVYKSMYLIYMSCDSEYEAAIKLLGNYQHWTKLKRCTWFLPYVEEWNAELVLRESALARAKLVALTEAGNVTAARTLLNGKKIAGRKVGKPKAKGKRVSDIEPGDIEEMLERTDISGKAN